MSSLNAFDLCRLWMCGCKSLQTKLGEGGGAQNFELDVRKLRFPSNRIFWPSLLSSLPCLTTLSLTVDAYTQKVGVSAEQIAYLPATLTSLALDFCDSLHVLAAAFRLPQCSFPKLTNLVIVEHSGYDVSYNLLPINWPKTILKLKITSSRAPVHLSVLPPTLTTLFARDCEISATDMAFPETMASIDLKVKNPQKLFPRLPSNLVSLTLSDYDNHIYDATECDWNALPRGLETLDFQVVNFKSIHCAQLPRTLKYISVGARDPMGGEFLDALPPSATYVDNLVPMKIGSKISALSLPRSLFEWPICDMGGIRKNFWPEVVSEAIPHLPPNTRSVYCVSHSLEPLSQELKSMGLCVIPVEIQRLRLRTCAGIASISVFQKSLEELTISSGPMACSAARFFEELPFYRLTTLQIHALVGKDCIPAEKWNLLPSTLRVLSLCPPDSLPAESSELLPRCLESLQLISPTGTEIHMDWFEKLPLTLSSFNVSGIASVILDEEHQLAANLGVLLTLALPPLLTFINLAFRCNIQQSPWLVPLFVASLPSSTQLCQISLSDDQDSLVKEEHLLRLPKALQQLELPVSSFIPEERRKILQERGVLMMSNQSFWYGM